MYENYANIRDSKGLKDSDVAKATGISPGTLSDWKKGRYNLKYDKLQKIAEFLGVSTDELAGVQTDEHDRVYYIDIDAAQFAQAIFKDPDLRALFDAASGISRKDLRLVIDMAKRFKETNSDEG